MLVVLGFLALTSWVGLLWAGIATGVAAVAGTGAVKAAKRRRSSPRRTGGTGGGLFPGLGRRRGGQTRKAGAPRNGMPRTGTPTRRPVTGRRTPLGSKATSASPAKPRAKGLRGLLGKSGTSPRQGTSARPAGRSRNPFARKAATGATATGSRPAGQRRSRNPFKRTSSTGTSARPAPGTSRSRNPFKRTSSSTKGAGTPTRSTGWRNPLKRTGTKPGTGPRSTTGKPAPRTGINPFRRRATSSRPGSSPTSGTRNPLRRKGTGPRTGTSATSTGSTRRGPAGWLKRRKGAAPTKTTTPTRIPIKRGTPPPPPPTRAQVKQGIRAQAAARREAAKAAPRGKVSTWLGSLGQPKPKRPKTTTVSTAGPAKFTGPARGKATVPTRAPQALLSDRKSARWSVGTGQDEEPGRRRSTPRPAPAPKRDAPAAPAPTPQPQQPKREAPSPPAKHSAKTCPVHGANCTVDHEAIRYGHKHDQPGRVPTTGGNKMRHAESGGRQDYDDMGLVAYINAQGGLQEGAAALAQQGEKMLAAADNQPLNPQVRENLQGFVAILKSAAGAGENLVPAARRHHETDFARAEEPRGSRTQEKNADVTKTEADGY